MKLARFGLALAFSLSVMCAAEAQETKWPEYSTLDSIYTAQDSAEIAINRAIYIDSTRMESWTQLVQLYKKRSEFETELTIALLSAGYNPDSAQAFYLLGDAQLDNGMIEEAIGSLQTAVTLFPRYVRAITMLAEAYDLNYQTDSSIVWLDRAIAVNPRSAQAHFQKAELLNRLGRRVESIESYQDWARLQPFVAEPWTKLGEVQCMVGDYEDAIESLNYSLGLNSESADAIFLLARANHGAGKNEVALQQYRDFFYRFPNHEHAMEAEQYARSLGWAPGVQEYQTRPVDNE